MNSSRKVNPLEKSLYCPRLRQIGVAAAAVLLLMAQSRVEGQTVLFFDDFNGSTLNPAWQPSLPNAHCGTFPSGTSLIATYVGAPNFAFQSLAGNSVLRMTNFFGPLQRRGWGLTTNFFAGDFHYEARFNTLVQAPGGSIDAFIEIWIMDALNTNRYDIISPFGGGFGSDLYVFTGSSIDNVYNHDSYSYQNNTWYRLVIDAPPGQNIHMSLHSDTGTELIGRTLAHTAAAFSSGFRIVLSQAIGDSGTPYPVDVAVDSVRLTTSGAQVPPLITNQPQSRVVDVGANVTLSVGAQGTAPLSYQWRFNTMDINGQTNATLALSNVQFTNQGNYSVRVTNAAGSVVSSNAILTVNRPPIANPQSVTLDENTTAAITLTGSDPDGNPLTYLLVSAPTNGTLSGTPPNLTYRPATNYFGADSFIFKVNDGRLDSPLATVIITVRRVNRPPTAQSESVAVPQNSPEPIVLIASDPDGDPLTYTVVAAPTNGVLSGTAPNLIYTPNTNYAGPDRFTFKANDGLVDSAVATFSLNVIRGSTLFCDTFNGPGLDPAWQASLPDAHGGSFPSGSSLVETYVGAPNFAFQTLNGSSVLRLTNFFGPVQRRGWSLSTNFVTGNFHFEARFNTLNQGPGGSIDAFIEIWILDTVNSNRYDIVSPYGGNFGAEPQFFSGSSIDAVYSIGDFAYQKNTWYRLVLEGKPGQNIRASLYSDDGTTELIGRSFAHSVAAFPSGFKIALSQAVGASGVPYPVDVAVDSVCLNTVNLAPVAQCKDIVVSADATCTANASVDNGSFDPDGDSITLRQAPSGPYPIGTNRVTLTATDSHGASNSCTALVIVRDMNPPTITCPTNIVTTNDVNQCGALVAFPLPIATDTCSAVTNIVCVPASASFFPVGTTTVQCRATDAAGNVGSCSFTVTVRDTQAPSVTCPADIVVTNAHNALASVVTFSPAIADNCPGVGLPACSPASGSAFAIGTNVVNCSAMDAAGNSSQCSFKITVQPGNKPPVPIIEVSPLASFPGLTNLIVIAPDNTNAPVVFDGSKSYDPDDSTFNYYWYEGTNLFSTNVIATNVLALGTHDITLWLDDTFPLGTNSATVEIEVISPCGGVGLVSALVEANANALGKNQRPLIATLEAACASFERGDPIPGVNQLHAFQNKVHAQIGPLDAALADGLSRAAQSIIDTFSRP